MRISLKVVHVCMALRENQTSNDFEGQMKKKGCESIFKKVISETLASQIGFMYKNGVRS